MSFAKVLELSTAHMRSSTDTLLTEYETRKEQKNGMEEIAVTYTFPRYIKVEAHHYGYIFFVSSELDKEQLEKDLEEYGMIELLPVFLYAVANGCSLINFDRDAETVETLSKFDWG